MDKKTVWRCNLSKVAITLLCVLTLVALVTAPFIFLRPNAVFAEEVTATVAFGETPSVTIPRLADVDVDAANYGAENDLVTLTLKFTPVESSSKTIGTFNRSQWANYINNSMPAGSYTLTVFNDGEKVQDIKFAVTQLTMPNGNRELDGVINAVKGLTFKFDFGGEKPINFVDESVEAKIAVLQKSVDNASPKRVGVWALEKYDSYFVTELHYNVSGLNSLTYRAEEELINEDGAPQYPGKYTVYFKVYCNNFDSGMLDSSLSVEAYEAARQNYRFSVAIVDVLPIPEVLPSAFTGESQKANIAADSRYMVIDDGNIFVGEHEVIVRLLHPEYCRWENHKLGETDCVVTFEITQAPNYWLDYPDIKSWIEGNFPENAIFAAPDSVPTTPAEGEDLDEETIESRTIFVGTAKFGKVIFVVTDVNDEEHYYYNEELGINELPNLKAGTYYLKAMVLEDANHNFEGLPWYGVNIHILEKEGLPWWATTAIAVGAALAVVIIFIILWKKGVFQILTGKLVLAIRTQATIDATIAAIRANKKAEEAKAAIAAAEAKEKAEARALAAKEARERPAEERAAELEEKASVAAQRAERMRARAESMRNNAPKPEEAEKPEEPAKPEEAKPEEPAKPAE